MKDKLVPWKKYDEHPFELLHREIDDLFDTYYRGFGKHPRKFGYSSGFEVSETDDEIRIKAELPGMGEKDIEVSIDENNLTIRGKHEERREEKKRNYHVSEMSHGSFFRSFPLSAAVDREKATGKFKHGVLTLTLPKTEQAKAERKRIPISTE